jgi:PTH1 family peptidyl-tRNA hydrolase
MHLLIGLGNPGNQYDGTRHNLGFAVIDTIAEFLTLPIKAGSGEYLLGTADHNGRKVGLVKPLTYMNNSGEAVIDVVERFNVPLSNILVICDDFQLPLGSIRLRGSGTDGGHNGLYSIIYHLQSDAFARLRLGISGELMPPRKSVMADYVLSLFEEHEKQTVKEMIARASTASLSFVANGLEKTMNTFNRKT